MKHDLTLHRAGPPAPMGFLMKPGLEFWSDAEESAIGSCLAKPGRGYPHEVAADVVHEEGSHLRAANAAAAQAIIWRRELQAWTDLADTRNLRCARA